VHALYDDESRDDAREDAGRTNANGTETETETTTRKRRDDVKDTNEHDDRNRSFCAKSRARFAKTFAS